MDGIKITFKGREYSLLYNGSAMFEVEARYSKPREVAPGADEAEADTFSIFDLIGERTPDGFKALCSIAAIMAEQGELMRRYMGYDAGAVLTAEELQIFLLPTEHINLYRAVCNAITKGYGREVEEEEIDLGLIELQKKTEADSPAPDMPESAQ